MSNSKVNVMELLEANMRVRHGQINGQYVRSQYVWSMPTEDRCKIIRNLTRYAVKLINSIELNYQLMIGDERPYQDNMKVLLIDDGALHWYVEESRVKALGSHAEHMGYKSIEDYEKDYDPGVVKQVDSNEVIKIVNPDDPSEPPIQQRAWQWAVDKHGLLASTEW